MYLLSILAKWFDQRMNKSNAIYAEAAEKLQEIMAELKSLQIIFIATTVFTVLYIMKNKNKIIS